MKMSSVRLDFDHTAAPGYTNDSYFLNNGDQVFLGGTYHLSVSVDTELNRLFVVDFYYDDLADDSPLVSIPSYKLPYMVSLPRGKYRIALRYPDSRPLSSGRLFLQYLSSSYDALLASASASISTPRDSDLYSQFAFAMGKAYVREAVHRGHGVADYSRMPFLQDYIDNAWSLYSSGLGFRYLGMNFPYGDWPKIFLSSVVPVPSSSFPYYEYLEGGGDGALPSGLYYWDSPTNDTLDISSVRDKSESMYAVLLAYVSQSYSSASWRTFLNVLAGTGSVEVRVGDSSNPDRIYALVSPDGTWRTMTMGAAVRGRVFLFEVSLRLPYGESLFNATVQTSVSNLSANSLWVDDLVYIFGTVNTSGVGVSYAYFTPSYSPLVTDRISSLVLPHLNQPSS